MTPTKWLLRTLAFAASVVAVVALAPHADAQPKADPKANPKGAPKDNPKDKANPQPKGSGPIVFQPQINGLVRPFNPAPFYSLSPIYNPAINNPFATNPFAPNPFAPNPFAPNPFAPNPFVNNPFAPNPFAPNPFINNPFLNPFTPNPFNNPLVNNPFVNNPFAPNPFAPNPFVAAFQTPPISFRQPGHLTFRGPDLLVNPWAGLVYRPLTGIARTADGTIFYRVPGTGVPTFTGDDAYGTGLYYSPHYGTYLNPNTGVITRPGTTVFLPWIP